MKTFRRLLIGALLGALAAYAVVLAALYYNQRSLIFPAPALAAELPEGYRQVALRTADGLSLAAAWRQPGEPGRPVLVFFHGNGDSWAGADRALRPLVGAGYGALLVEYRGYGANPGEPSEQGFYADGRAALAWLGAQGFSPGQVVLVGNSIGSGVATQLATEVKPAALVLVSPFADLAGVVGDKFPWLPAGLLLHDRFENAAKLGRVAAPVLVLHGTADTMVLPAHAQRLAQAQPRARLILVPGTDHDLAYLPVAQGALLTWLGQVLAKPQPDSRRDIGGPDVQPGKQQP